MKYLTLFLIILSLTIISLFYAFNVVKDLTRQVVTSNEVNVQRLQLLDSQISKMNILIVDLETFIKKNKAPAIE